MESFSFACGLSYRVDTKVILSEPFDFVIGPDQNVNF